MKELEKRMVKYQQAAMFLGGQCVLPASLHIVAITQPLPNQKVGSEDAEVLLSKDAPWGISVKAPEDWGPQASTASLQTCVQPGFQITTHQKAYLNRRRVS